MIIEEQGKRACRGRRKSDRELEAQFELMRIIAEQNHEITFEYDVEFDRAALYEVVNGKFTERYVFENYTKYLDEYISDMEPDEAKSYKKAFLQCLKKPSHFVLDLRVNFGKKAKEWHRLFLASVDDLDGNITTVAGRFVSIHSEKIANENIKHKAEIDALTGIYNHITFENKCSQRLKKCKSELLFMMFDIDDFKIINDTLGHNVGDLVLSQTGEILNEILGDKGFAGRLGGDEFAVMAWGFTDEASMRQFCSDLRMNLKRIIFDMEYSASIGVSFLKGRSLTFKDVYYEADQATYTAKRCGKNQIVYFDDITVQVERKSEIESKGVSDNKESATFDISKYDDIMIIDNRDEYIIVVDVSRRRIVQANREAKKALNISIEEWLDSPCNDLFGECSGICEKCGKNGERYFISKACDRKNDKLTKMFGEKDFIVHIVPIEWHGMSLKTVSLIDIDNAKQVASTFIHKDNIYDSIEDILDYVLKSQGEYEHRQILRMACSFYDADCGMLIYSNGGKFDKAEISCKPNMRLMGETVKNSIENGGVKKYWKLLDEEGESIIRKTDKLKDVNGDLYRAFVDSRIWSSIGIRIGNETRPAGFLTLFNPRQNEDEKRFYKFVAAIFANELTRREAMDELEYSKSFDVLTGVYSRHSFSKFHNNLESYDISSLGIFATDIIGLKLINREFGYDNGNKKLRELADCIATIFAGYIVCRYEDDQIVAFCRNIDEDGFQKLVRWCSEMVNELDFPVAIGYGWTTNVNITQQMEEINEMLIRDKNEKIESQSDNEITLGSKILRDVKGLMEEGVFQVFLQPKVNIRTGKTVGAESLIRLIDKEKGIVGPIHFISIFEKYNIVHEIDLYVLDKVCAFQKDKLIKGEPVVPISVNFSKKTLEYDKLIDSVREIMQKYELPAGTIQIEITETVGDMDHMLIRDVANSLRMMGFVLAMDDFGTKYSNIAMLVQFQFGIAKIDRSLIKDIVENDKSVVVLRHMTEMIKELGIECVVEGAETEEQIEILKTMSCDVIQGYYYGKPVNIEEFYGMFME